MQRFTCSVGIHLCDEQILRVLNECFDNSCAFTCKPLPYSAVVGCNIGELQLVHWLTCMYVCMTHLN